MQHSGGRRRKADERGHERSRLKRVKLAKMVRTATQKAQTHIALKSLRKMGEIAPIAKRISRVPLKAAICSAHA
jgi:hypothetical protein